MADAAPTVSAYRSLKPQLKRFVDLLVRRTNGTDAIRKIRPHLKKPEVLASKWKALPQVQAAIAERELQAMEDAGITNAQILLGIAATADFDVRKLTREDGTPKDLHELDDETARIIQGVEVEVRSDKDGKKTIRTKFRLPQRNEARKLLGQHKRLFTEKHEHSGPDGGPIPTQTEVIDPIEAARRYKQLMDGTA